MSSDNGAERSVLGCIGCRRFEAIDSDDWLVGAGALGIGVCARCKPWLDTWAAVRSLVWREHIVEACMRGAA